MLEQNGGRARATGYKQNSGLHWKKISPKSRIQATDPKLPNKIFREHWKREISCCQAQRHQTRPIKTGCANGLTTGAPRGTLGIALMQQITSQVPVRSLQV